MIAALVAVLAAWWASRVQAVTDAVCDAFGIAPADREPPR